MLKREMAESNRTEALAFLYKIMDDTQGTIRFLDTKAAFGIAILGAIVSKLLDPDQVSAYRSHGLGVEIVWIALVLLLILSAFLGFRTIFPVINPAANVSFPDNLEPKFFISEFGRRGILRLFSSSKKFSTLKTTHTEYSAAVEGATIGELRAVAAAEVLKLSFVRQLKTDRLQWFTRTMIATVFLFIAVMIFAPKGSSETHIQIVHDSQPLVVQVPQAPCSSQTRQDLNAAQSSSPPGSKPTGATPSNANLK
jgi:hypothetical protein